MVNILGLGISAHKLKKELDNNILRAKIIDAIENKKAYTPEMVIEITGLTEDEIMPFIDEWENDDSLRCNSGGSKTTPFSFETLRKLR